MKNLARQLAARSRYLVRRRHPSELSSASIHRVARGAQPFFIVGSGRSGTTLLRRLLMTNCRAFIPPETYVLGQVARAFPKSRELDWTCLVEGVVEHFQNHPEFRHFGIADMRPFVEAANAIPEEDRSLERILDDLYRFFAREAGFEGDRWGDKTPYNTYFMPDIARVFPRGRFVHMLRDGPDVVRSMIAAGRYTAYEDAARRWRDAVELTGDFDRRFPGRMITVRYEDLVRDPDATLHRLRDFLDLEVRGASDEQAILERLGDVNGLAHHANVLRPVSDKSIGEGRRTLTAEQRKSLAPILDRPLRDVGYPALPLAL